MSNIEIDLTLNADEAITKLEKIKLLLEDINKLDNNFSLSNVIEIKDDTILLFKMNTVFLKSIDYKKIEDELSTQLKCKCLLLMKDIELHNALSYGIDKSKEREYETETCYVDGEILSEKTIQYK